jgi:hypothetical protein
MAKRIPKTKLVHLDKNLISQLFELFLKLDENEKINFSKMCERKISHNLPSFVLEIKKRNEDKVQDLKERQKRIFGWNE